MIVLHIGIRLDIAYLYRRIAVDATSPDTSFIIIAITIDTESREIENKREKCHLMGSKLGYYEKNRNNHDTYDKKWCCWYPSLKFIKKTKSQYNAYDDNTHLTQTQVKNNGIFVFDLDRNLVLHRVIVP